MDLSKILESHKRWATNQDGKKADLSGADLRRADLCGANLSWADLCGANLSWANLCEAKLRKAKLVGANLSGANLSWADLRWAALSWADLRGVNLSGANLDGANLCEADLSGATGLLATSEYLLQFSRDEYGYIFYRTQNGYKYHPEGWEFSPGKFITETPNPDRCTLCGCGVGVATLEWIKKEWRDEKKTIWKCRIRFEDLGDLIVPYNTDGKARCGRLELLEVLEVKNDVTM